jgi:hypothetical protein
MTNMKTPGIFIAVFAVYCICALCIGMSSAADVTTSSANHNSTFYAGPGHRLSPETINVNHEHNGVKLSEVKTALRDRDNAAVMTRPGSHCAAHPAVMGAGRPGFDLTNATRQQQVISRLEKDNVDVTEFRADLLNDNIDAAKALLDAYMQSHRNNISAHMNCG